MNRQTRRKVTRKGSVAKDLTPVKAFEVKGGVVTDNQDPDGTYRHAAPAGFFRSARGLDFEAE